MSPDFMNGFDVPDDQNERHYDVFEEVALVASHLRKLGILDRICERVRFARRRFGRYDVIDFLAVLAGLRHQWRAHPGRVLRAAPTLCDPQRARYLSVTSSPLARRSRAFVKSQLE
jgi:hypothetical protein